MPVGSQRRQRQLLPLCYLPATHRAANFATFENSAKHLSIGMFFVFGLRAVAAKEADKVPQSGWREESRRARIHRRASFQLGERQICPDPGYRRDASMAKSHQYIRSALAPEDPP